MNNQTVHNQTEPNQLEHNQAKQNQKPADKPDNTFCTAEHTLENTHLKVATFNLFNYLEPPNAFYDFDRIYSAAQWQKKQKWIGDYLQENQPDIIGFQEVFSIESLKALVSEYGYEYFEVVDKPEVEDEFIYRSPVVALASRYPIVEAAAVNTNTQLATALGLTEDFSFSRKVIRATVDVPHLGECDCYVVHFKSKRSMFDVDENGVSSADGLTAKLNAKLTAELSIVQHLKAQVAGSWGSTIQRGSEAALLMVDMIERRSITKNPMILMGDFNNTLADGVLSHLLTDTLRFVSRIDSEKYLAQYCLQDSWSLFKAAALNEAQVNVNMEHNTDLALSEPCKTDSQTDGQTSSKAVETMNLTRSPTHYFGGGSSVLDYILLSCEFDASFHDSLYQVSHYETYDRHLINPIFDRDGESTDHGIVLITLSLRS